MKGQTKKQNGITLIALVITIIVMLILAGVSINLVVGENGILGKAQSAVTKTNRAKIEEEAQMMLTDWQTDYYSDHIAVQGRTGTTQSGAKVICGSNYVYVIDTSPAGKAYLAPFSMTTGLGEFQEVSADVGSQFYKAQHPEEHMPATTGWDHIDGEWNTGYVIKEASTGDEFVWIPVYEDSLYAKKSGSRNYHNKEYNNNEIGVDVLSAGFIQGDITGLSTILGESVSQDLPNVSPEALVVNNAGGFWVSRYEIGIASATRETAQSSWATNAIFSKQGCEPVRNITQTKALELANAWKTGENVQSGLITGIQWDVMCNFIDWSTCDGDCTIWGNYLNNASKAYTAGTVHSVINENYEYWYTTPIEKTGSQSAVFATGAFESATGRNTAQKNIFDIAGNVWEWTTEVPLNGNGTHRVVRGGSASYHGNIDVATYRYGYGAAGSSNWNRGFRAVLYVK